MIIKADNRGRLALGKARGGTISVEPHTEWNVEYQEGSITLKPHPEPEKSEIKWRNWGRLDPDLIGQVIYVEYDNLPTSKGEVVLRGVTGDYAPRGIVGTLEWYLTDAQGREVKSVKISGHDAIEFENYGMFWVKA